MAASRDPTCDVPTPPAACGQLGGSMLVDSEAVRLAAMVLSIPSVFRPTAALPRARQSHFWTLLWAADFCTNEAMLSLMGVERLAAYAKCNNRTTFRHAGEHPIALIVSVRGLTGCALLLAAKWMVIHSCRTLILICM